MNEAQKHCHARTHTFGEVKAETKLNTQIHTWARIRTHTRRRRFEINRITVENDAFHHHCVAIHLLSVYRIHFISLCRMDRHLVDHSEYK